MQAVAERFEGNVFDDFGDKGGLEQQSGLLFFDAALPHIEKGGLVHLPDSTSMTATYVVGIDFQHRLRVHAGRTRGTEIGISLLAHGLLCSLAHQHLAGKGSYGTVIEHVLVEFARLTIRNLMVDERIVIDTLHLVGNDAAVRCHLAAFALQPDIEAVARVAIEERQAGVVQMAVASLLDEDTVVAGAEQVRFLHLVKAEV